MTAVFRDILGTFGKMGSSSQVFCLLTGIPFYFEHLGQVIS
jgi:hypothetical protein